MGVGTDQDAGFGASGFSRRATLAGLGVLGAGAVLGALARPQAAYAAVATPGGSTGIDVRKEGARGDGTTDDGPAFQRALDQAPSAGGLVVVPPGTYAIGQALTATAPIRIVGLAGWASGTVVLDTAAQAGLTIKQAGTTEAYPGPAIQLVDLTFQYAGTGAAVLLDESPITAHGPFQDTLVQGCRFHLTEGGTGLLAQNLRDPIITQSQFLGPAAGTGTGLALSDSDNAKVIGNVFYNLQFGVHGLRAPVREFNAGCVLVGNTMFGFQDAFRFEDYELVQASGNILDGADESCLFLEDCYHCLLTQNYLGLTGAGNALLIQTQQPSGTEFLGQITFQGNYINHYMGATGSATIGIFGVSPTLPVDQVLIEGNVLNGYPQLGVELRNAQNVLISNNTFMTAATGSGVAAVMDHTPGNNHIFHNLVDAPIVATGDTVEDNFTRAPLPS